MARPTRLNLPPARAAVWVENDPARVALWAEVFGTPSSGVAATIAGVQAAASTGAVAASGAVDRTITGVQAAASAGALAAVTGFNQAITGVQSAASAGALAPSGGLVVAITGAQATTQAGALTAGGVAPPGPTPVPSGGGGRTPARRRIELPDLILPEPPPPPIRIPARADVLPAVAYAAAGSVRAAGARSVMATVVGAASKSACESISVKASVIVALPSTAANRAPAVVCLGSVSGRAGCAEVKALGVGISDEEILALLVAA